ncbi:MAG: hypothetical protein D6696_06110, partial [Acidobacteria bacterium]
MALVAGCSGSPPPRAGAAAAAQSPAAVAVTGLSVVEAEGTTQLEVAADGPLHWTTYRTPEGDLVVELADAAPAAGVTSLAPAAGLVSRVEVERDVTALTRRPMTRLRIATRRPAVHALDLEAHLLRVRFTPLPPPAAEP